MSPALVHGCNPSPWNLVDEVEGEPQMPMPGNGSGSDLAAPSGVVVSVLRNTIGVTWTPGANGEQQKAVLFNADVTDIVDINTQGADGRAHTFTNVPPGTYQVVVASFRTGEDHKLSALFSVTVQ